MYEPKIEFLITIRKIDVGKRSKTPTSAYDQSSFTGGVGPFVDAYAEVPIVVFDSRLKFVIAENS